MGNYTDRITLGQCLNECNCWEKLSHCEASQNVALSQMNQCHLDKSFGQILTLTSSTHHRCTLSLLPMTLYKIMTEGGGTLISSQEGTLGTAISLENLKCLWSFILPWLMLLYFYAKMMHWLYLLNREAWQCKLGFCIHCSQWLRTFSLELKIWVLFKSYL